MTRATLAALLLAVRTACAVQIGLPTGNDGLLRSGGDVDFFQPTADGGIESGMFGCVRSNGSKFHEGIDIKCLRRDKRREPTDPVLAVSDGTVAFINTKPGLSNYGRYIILEHRWDGVQVYTLYAHLQGWPRALVSGETVRKGQQIAWMGRSTNSAGGITSERAHLHFEINFMLNPNFNVWFPKREPAAPPFGNFNGQNFIGLDPASLLRASVTNPKLNFAQYVAKQRIAFTVLVGARPFPWLTMHPEQIQRTATIAPGAYEIGMTAWGLPIAVWPRSAAEIVGSQHRILNRGLPVLKLVNETELANNNCQGLVRRGAHGWKLTERGRDWIALLTYAP